ncbi:leucyl aminopeptidase family protein [Arenicella xantha]|uniref:Probable cytosol aminopeptidase n=1 Tax=Arenicella xantha TaxID=644221 RepID=A0A395JNL4_9GAMM|nr:leucyl aminopeptidase [Arenicella xantha]RBP51154.1 leucyl aminopeptidase [Arenicella xantha]
MKILGFLIVWMGLVSTSVAQQNFEFASFTIPEDGRIVLPVAEGESFNGVAGTIDVLTKGALTVAAQDAHFTGEVGSTLTLRGVTPFSRIDLIGVGSETVGRVAAENFGGTASALLGDTEGGSVQILWPQENIDADATAARVALGYQLRSYRFDQHKAEPLNRDTLPSIKLFSDDDSATAYNDDLKFLAEGVFFARNMSSEPANIIYPESFVERVRTEFADLANVSIKVLDEEDMQRLNMGALWGVGKGSSRPPRLLIVEYMAGGNEAPVVLAGKGITFDTGGISIKQNKNMWMMKGDLGGAAVVTGTLLAAAKRGAAINVVALAALAENMPSGTAIRPGDVLQSMSGLSIEISSTDAEGRLVLADAVHYGQIIYEPRVLIDVATLTGSVGRALGDEYAGVFGRHDEIIEQLSAASAAAGEGVWRLPLNQSHFKQIESKYGDIVNGGVGSPGASVGAAFIGSFVKEDQVWAHFDIAGVDYLDEDRPTVPKGYSGWGVRTLDEYLRHTRSVKQGAE